MGLANHDIGRMVGFTALGQEMECSCGGKSQAGLSKTTTSYPKLFGSCWERHCLKCKKRSDLNSDELQKAKNAFKGDGETCSSISQESLSSCYSGNQVLEKEELAGVAV